MHACKNRQRIVTGCLSAVVVLLCGSQSHAQELLRWKLSEGENLTYVMEQDMTMTVVTGENTLITRLSQVMDMDWQVKSVDEKGNASLGQTVTRIRMNMETPQFGNLSYDSDVNEPVTNPLLTAMTRTFETLVDSEIGMTLSPLGEATDIVLPERMLAEFEQNSAMAGMGMGREFFEQIANQAGVILPEAVATPSDSWSHRNAVDLPFGRMIVDAEYTYKGLQSRDDTSLARINLVPTMSIEAVPNGPFQMRMTDSTGAGTIWFDPRAGHLVASTMTLNTQFEIEAPVQSFTQEIDQTVTMKLVQ